MTLVHFEDKWVATLAQSTTFEDCPEKEPLLIDPVENWILCQWTGQEVTRLLSALLVGANLIYPDARHEVVLSFLRQWECPNMICDLVAQCIENAAGSGNALDIAMQKYLNQHPWQSLGTSADTNALEGSGCSLDNIFAFCRQLVQLMNAAITDTFELVEQATNNLEYIEVFIDQVPIFGALYSFVMAVQENVSDAYAATYTTELENEYACALFCIAVNNGCSLTLRDAAGYFSDLIDHDITFGGFEEALDFLLTGTPVGDEICAYAFATMLGVLLWGGAWAGLSMADLVSMLGAISNDTDSDWESLCAECTPWHATFDLTASMSMFDIEVGSWYSGSGIHTANDEGSEPIAEAFRFNYDWDTATTLTHAKCTLTDLELGTWNGDNGLWAIVAAGDFANMLASRAQMVASGLGSYEGDIDVSIEPGSIQALYLRVARGEMDGHATVSTFELWGYGDPGAQFKSDATTFEYQIP